MRYAADNFFDVELETYAPTLFDSDSIDPQVMDADYVCPHLTSLDRQLTRWDVLGLISKVVTPQIDVDSSVTSNCTWTGSGGDTVTWSKTDSAETIQFRYKGTSYDITPSSTTKKYIYWDLASPTVFSSSDTQSSAVGASKIPLCFNDEGVADPAWGYRLINTKKIIDNAVTDDCSAYTLSGQELSTAGYVTIQSVAFTACGGPVFIHCSTLLLATIGDNSVQARIRRMDNGTGTTLYTTWTAIECPQDWGVAVCLAIKDTPPAGTYTYIFQGLENFNGSKDTYAYNTTLFVQELKK